MAALPTSSSGVVETFKIPNRFSFSTMDALKLGNITRNVRVEIVTTVALQVNLVLSNTCFPLDHI